MKSFKICDCEKLKTIEIEDGKPWENNGALWNVKDVKIGNLPNLNSLVIGNESFLETESLSLSSNSIEFNLAYIFLLYNHSKQEIIHSKMPQVYL